MKGDAFKLAAAAAKIQTVAGALGVLRVATEYLELAAPAIEGIDEIYSLTAPVGALFGSLTGSTEQVQQQLRDELEQARNEVARHSARYRGYAPEDLDQEISTASSMGIASTAQYVNKIINNVIGALNDPPEIRFWDFVAAVEQVLDQAIKKISQGAGYVAQGAANVAAAVVSAFWQPIVLIGGGALIFYAWRQGWLKGGAA